MTILKIFKKSQINAKDRGYAWVILFFSFLSHFAHLGFSYGTAGNLTIAHQKVFNIDLQKGSLLGTIHIGLLLLLGKFVISQVHMYAAIKHTNNHAHMYIRDIHVFRLHLIIFVIDTLKLLYFIKKIIAINLRITE